MPLACPECGSNSALEITLAMELPSDSRSDDIILQVFECRRCGFSGVGVYEESRRGAMGSEAFEHTGYRAGKITLEEIKAAIHSCPQPQNESCRCASHQWLGRQDKNGRWDGLSGLALSGYFNIIYFPDDPMQ